MTASDASTTNDFAKCSSAMAKANSMDFACFDIQKHPTVTMISCGFYINEMPKDSDTFFAQYSNTYPFI